MEIISFLTYIFTFTVLGGYGATFDKCSTSRSAYPPDPDSRCCGTQHSDRIIGGKYAYIDQYPWTALLEYDTGNGTRLLCGGTLISSRYVLTAAHCVTGPHLAQVTLKSIRLGEHDIGNHGLDCVDVGGGLDCADPVLLIPVEEIHPHPDYDLRSRRNDIALVRLKTLAPITDFIQPICLPAADIAASRAGRVGLWTAGWGVPASGLHRTNVKQHVGVPYVTQEVCQPMYNVEGRRADLWEKQICAGGEREDDSCKVDSGGGLMWESASHIELVGVVSFGNYPCGADLAPAVFTNVFKYKHWIHDTIKV